MICADVKTNVKQYKIKGMVAVLWVHSKFEMQCKKGCIFIQFVSYSIQLGYFN